MFIIWIKKLNLVRIYIPKSDIAPHTVQMTKLKPIDPVLISSSVGETNIPEPIKIIIL